MCEREKVCEYVRARERKTLTPTHTHIHTGGRPEEQLPVSFALPDLLVVPSQVLLERIY